MKTLTQIFPKKATPGNRTPARHLPQNPYLPSSSSSSSSSTTTLSSSSAHNSAGEESEQADSHHPNMEPRAMFEESDIEDLQDDQIDQYTKDFCTQVDDDDDDDDSGDFVSTDLSQALICEEAEEPQPKRAKIPSDTELQAFCPVNGVTKVLKVGECYTTTEQKVGKLCKKNNVPEHVTDAFFVIQRLFTNEKLQKHAECSVWIHFCDAFKSREREKIRVRYPDAKRIVLRFTEQVRLSSLQHLEKRFTPPTSDPLVWHVTGNGGANYEVQFDSKRTFCFTHLDGKTPTVLELFGGAGGMSLGFENAGFNVRWIVEHDVNASGTLKLNHRNSLIFNEDVKLFLEKARKNEHRTSHYPKPGEVHHIHASPPCQGHSSANRTGGKNDESNNALTFEWIKAIRYFQPQTASFENVTGMLYTEGNLEGEIVNYWEKLLSELLVGKPKYHIRAGILNAADYGDPQARKRLFIIAVQPGRRLPDFPAPLHGNHPLLARKHTPIGVWGPSRVQKLPHRTVQDALDDLKEVDPEAGNGGIYLSDDKIIFDHRVSGTELKSERQKLRANAPAPTILRQNGIEHYSLLRGLTVAELKRLMSFPDDYEIFGSITQQKNQIGNAVSVGLAKAVATVIQHMAYPV